jgi:hypothetical protein
MSIYFSLQSPLSAPLASASFQVHLPGNNYDHIVYSIADHLYSNKTDHQPMIYDPPIKPQH